MDLGAFSISLAVKDIGTSRDFYAHFGFVEAGGDASQGWLILRSGTTTIGLFQGMFEENLLTINPGWDDQAQPVAEFEDVRAIQARLQAAGIGLTTQTDPDGEGPAHISLKDPDGNVILIDQHV